VQHGYIKIRLGTDFIYAHRLAWLLTYGRPVPDEIDHADGERSNNRITNLRAATRETNSVNIRTRQNTATGVKGVNWCAQTGRYRAIIKSNKKRYNLGRFNTLEEAVAARREAANRLHGAFARHD
jgi:ribosomal protein S14